MKRQTKDEHILLLTLLADIRKAAGDEHGKLMQDELVEHVRKLRMDADKWRDMLAQNAMRS